MIIYIIHQNCYYTFNLNVSNDGKYILSDYDQNLNNRSLANVEVKDNKVFINSNENIKIFSNNNQYDNIELLIGNFYTLDLISGEKIVLFIAPAYDNTFVQKKVAGNSIIKIGNTKENDIIYYGVLNETIELSYNGKFHIKGSNKTPIYINQSLKNDVTLDNFDIVFINGLKIIICRDTLFINNIENKVLINSKSLFNVDAESLVVQNMTNSFNNFKDFYDENNYFFKSPVFQHKTDLLKIEISEPPTKEEKDKESVFMTTVPTFVMSLTSVITAITSIRQYRNGATDADELLTDLLMAFSILIGAIVWPFVEKWARNMKVAANNRIRQKKYKKYLQDKEKILENASKEQKISLAMNNPEVSECESIIINRKPELFNRNIENINFLTVRLGIGKTKLACDLDYKKQEYILEKDPLVTDLETLIDKYKYIDSSPYLLSLKNIKVCAFIGNENVINDYMNNIILQIITYHSYLDLKIVILTSKISELSYLKNINHCFDDEKNNRYYATNILDAQNISSMLERELNQRKIKNEEFNAPYYLVISDCIDVYRNLNIIDDIIDADEKLNFGLLMFDTKISDIPNKCINFVNISKEEGAFFQTDMSLGSIEHFSPQFLSNYDVNYKKLVTLISDIPLKNNTNTSLVLPDNYDFLEMYNIGNIEQFNIDQRWNNSNLYNSLAAPLGLDVNGNIINLDLHEKNHGPHGLIAGMTGSGKSELIITFILSLAVNYRPNEVQFVLIDYKGGGLAGAFENRKTGLKLPHLVGTITNLDKAEMKRTLVSIKSELQRRQKLFNEAKENLDAGNIDIYKYQRLYREGKVTKPLSHLFIICDEFAELKAQQPDFMDELVSAARIGRSLGIHLILATQKPSGIVDDQIWSNSKFKISCKVQTTEDSNEVIKKPDAAFLKEAGRFYLQVGYDEYYIEGQSAYTGNNYVPSETYNAKIDNSIAFINDSGSIIKTIGKKAETKTVQKNLGDELTNILKYIINVADKLGYKKNQLWLDNVSQVIFHNNIVNKYQIQSSPFIINPVIGEFDDPENQRQGPVVLDITNGGNVYIVGMSGSGKSTLLSTFVYASIINHNCDEVNFYIIDCGSEKLKIFEHAPQVGNVLTVSDTQKIKNLFYLINSEIIKRQKYYSANGGNFISDCKSGKSVFSNLVIIINDFEVFKEAFEEIFDFQFAPITRNCSKYGIYFIVTSTSVSSLTYSLENSFPQKIMLNMVDSSDFTSFFEHAPIPNGNSGRGVIEIDEPYEFQTALAFREKDYAKNMNYIFTQLNRFLKNHAKPVPVVPKIVKFDLIESIKPTFDNVPVGINEQSAQIGYINLNNYVTFISSINKRILKRFLPNLIKILSKIDNTKIVIVNALSEETYSDEPNVKEYNSGFKKVIKVINDSLQKQSNSNVIVIILGYNKLECHLEDSKDEDDMIITLEELISNTEESGKYKYLIYELSDVAEEFKKYKAYEYADNGIKLWLGANFDDQDVFEYVNNTTDEYKPTNNDITIIDDDRVSYIKFVK